MNDREKDGHLGHDQRRRRNGGGGVCEAALTVIEGVALKPIQVLLVQHPGQVTAIDEAGLTYGNEAADQGHE